MSDQLIFVYNARAGLVSALLDSIHKMVAPSTYPCSLCDLTYSLVHMDPRWRAYLAALPLPTRFFHRQDFAATYPDVVMSLPLVAIDRDGKLQPLLTAPDLATFADIAQLIAALDAALDPALDPAIGR